MFPLLVFFSIFETRYYKDEWKIEEYKNELPVIISTVSRMGVASLLLVVLLCTVVQQSPLAPAGNRPPKKGVYVVIGPLNPKSKWLNFYSLMIPIHTEQCFRDRTRIGYWIWYLINTKLFKLSQTFWTNLKTCPSLEFLSLNACVILCEFKVFKKLPKLGQAFKSFNF